MTRLLRGLLIVVVAGLLAGCTWFPEENLTVNTPVDSNQPPTNIAANIPPSATGANEQRFSNEEFGFSFTYPTGATIEEATSCIEGCPEGSRVPIWIVSESAGMGNVSIATYKDEKAMLLGTGYSSLDEFFSSSEVSQLEKDEAGNVHRYSYVYDQVGGGLFGDPPTMRFLVVVRPDGRLYRINVAAADAAHAETFEIITASFSV